MCLFRKSKIKLKKSKLKPPKKNEFKTFCPYCRKYQEYDFEYDNDGDWLICKKCQNRLKYIGEVYTSHDF